MTKLRRLLSLNLIITAGPILMLALLSLVLGVDRYRSEYDRTFDHTVQMARVSAQPIVSLVSNAMAGGNYAAIQEDAAIDLLKANNRMRLLVVEGKTSVKEEAFGFVFDRASGRVYRTTWSAAEVADLRKKVSGARQALAGMEPGSPRYSQLSQRLTLWQDLVRRSTEDVAAAQRLLGSVERPRQTPSISGVDYDSESELLHLTLRTEGVQGSVWMVLDGAHLANVGNEVLKGVLPINIAGLFIVAGLSLLLSRLVVGPLHRMTRTMRDMADGTYPDAVPDTERQDEIGDMAKALEVFKSNAETVDMLVRRITDDARHVSASAGQASAATTQVSAGARSQLEAVQQVAAALSQSADAITDVARSAQTASEQSRESSQLVGSGAERIAGMVDVVRAMADDSSRIGKIVSDISVIADQTNMLALNTAIEAAHAGEHGQGFSVVADEVRKLSENTHALAQSIGEIIAEASERASSGLDMAEEIASSVQRIGEIVQRNERLVSAIAAAVEQQQTAVGDIKHSVEELDRIGQANASASEEIATTMHKLADLSSETTRQVEAMNKRAG